MTTQDIVQKLWNLCDVLRDAGITHSDCVTEPVLPLKLSPGTGPAHGSPHWPPP